MNESNYKRFLKEMIYIFCVSLITCLGVKVGLPMANILACILALFALYSICNYIVQIMSGKIKPARIALFYYTWLIIVTIVVIAASITKIEFLNYLSILLMLVSLVFTE